eukprot:TRINITY_DN118881_c0_g2_i1.p1 TRINITY_DN118881_c0_g2~~TRINITY_DN118881_c0_g2_i1.p1  ORF type:complete len:122 (+),score=13.34 TRINITY_DN118881_c0_g2_i1:51-416(+)
MRLLKQVEELLDKADDGTILQDLSTGVYAPSSTYPPKGVLLSDDISCSSEPAVVAEEEMEDVEIVTPHMSRNGDRVKKKEAESKKDMQLQAVLSELNKSHDENFILRETCAIETTRSRELE